MSAETSNAGIFRYWDLPGKTQANDPRTVHMCPPEGTGMMPCCDLPPFERMGDRITLDPKLVTCNVSSHERRDEGSDQP
jgi:hypothetical protein